MFLLAHLLEVEVRVVGVDGRRGEHLLELAFTDVHAACILLGGVTSAARVKELGHDRVHALAGCLLADHVLSLHARVQAEPLVRKFLVATNTALIDVLQVDMQSLLQSLNWHRPLSC